MMLIIDGHVHVGSEVDGPEDVRKFLVGPMTKPLRDYFVKSKRWPPLTIDDLIYSMDDAGIRKSAIFGRDYSFRPPGQKRYIVSAEHVAKYVDRFPDRLFGVAGINPWVGGKKCAKLIKYYVEDLHMKGVGELFTPSGISPTDKERCYPIYEACIEYDIPVYFHVGGEGPHLPNRLWWNGQPVTHPLLVEQVAKDFPELRIAMHNGFPAYVPEAMMVIISNYNRNIWVDTILIHPLLSELPWMKNFSTGTEWLKFVQIMCPDRVIFGTDYPFVPQKEVIEYINSIPELTSEFKEKLFENNAKEVYKI